MLEVQELVVGYAAPVLGPVSFALEPGQALGLSGANGCGKSTLMRALTGQTRIFSGQIMRAPGLRIACQQQHPVRLVESPLSVTDYLRLTGADAKPLPGRLAKLARRRIDTLSGGQYQLLAVWAALAAPAQAVLLDEPTNNLDPEGVALLLELLQGQRHDRGLLLVSHDEAFMAEACDAELNLTLLHRAGLNGDLHAPAV